MSDNRFSRVSNIINEKVSLADYLSRGLNYSIGDNDLPKSVSCPLHKDEKPSLRLYYPKDRGGFCFSCGRSLTAFYVHKELSNDSFSECVRFFIQNFSDLVSINDIEKENHLSGRCGGIGDFKKKSKESELLASALSECFSKFSSMSDEDRRIAFRDCDVALGRFSQYLKQNDKQGAVTILKSLVLSFRDKL